MYVVVGLGNPGKKYERTRHNVGFDVLDVLARRASMSIERTKCKALVGEGTIAGQRVALCKPQTFMNLSGESVSQLISWYKPDRDKLIVLFDDVDLPIGKVRFRDSGSAGTHNGMRDIIARIGFTDFPRIRVGIGRPPEGFDLKDFVLTTPRSEEDITAMKDGFLKAAEAVEVYIRDGLNAARAFVGR